MILVLSIALILMAVGWALQMIHSEKGRLHVVEVPMGLRGISGDAEHAWASLAGRDHAFTAEQLQVAAARAERLKNLGIKP